LSEFFYIRAEKMHVIVLKSGHSCTYLESECDFFNSSTEKN